MYHGCCSSNLLWSFIYRNWFAMAEYFPRPDIHSRERFAARCAKPCGMTVNGDIHCTFWNTNWHIVEQPRLLGCPLDKSALLRSSVTERQVELIADVDVNRKQFIDCILCIPQCVSFHVSTWRHRWRLGRSRKHHLSMLASNAQDCSGMRLVCSAGRGRINSLRRESSEVSRGFVRVSAARKNAQQASKQAKPSSQQVSTTCTIRTRTCEPQVSCDVHVNSLSCVRRVLVAHWARRARVL